MPFSADTRLPVARKAPRKGHSRTKVLFGIFLVLCMLITASLTWSHTSVHWLQSSSDGPALQRHIGLGQPGAAHTHPLTSERVADSKHDGSDSEGARASSKERGTTPDAAVHETEGPAALQAESHGHSGSVDGDEDDERDIVLHADAVAKVLEKARMRDKAQQGDASQSNHGSVPLAERYKELYDHAQGTVVFPPSAGADACPQGSKPPVAGDVIAAVVVSCSSSPQALKRVLDALLQQLGQDDVRGAFHVYIAQEGTDKLVRQVALRYATETVGAVRFLQHVPAPDSKQPQREGAHSNHSSAAHQRFLLHTFFRCFHYQHLLLLDDALELAPDALSFYVGAVWLPQTDPSVWCISGWNDNGVKSVALDEQVLWRTDYHPGRAWMLSRGVGAQLLEQWPTTGDWHGHLLGERVRQGRQCIVPEVPRARQAGMKLQLNEDAVDWLDQDLGVLLFNEYDKYLAGLLAAAPVVQLEHVQAYDATDACMLTYFTEDNYAQVARVLHIAPPLPQRWRMPYCFDADALISAHEAAPRTAQASTSKHRRVCQGFLPRQAFKSVVMARNQHGVRVFLLSKQLAILLNKVPDSALHSSTSDYSTPRPDDMRHAGTAQRLLLHSAAQHPGVVHEHGVLAGHTKLLEHIQ